MQKKMNGSLHIGLLIGVSLVLPLLFYLVELEDDGLQVDYCDDSPLETAPVEDPQPEDGLMINDQQDCPEEGLPVAADCCREPEAEPVDEKPAVAAAEPAPEDNGARHNDPDEKPAVTAAEAVSDDDCAFSSVDDKAEQPEPAPAPTPDSSKPAAAPEADSQPAASGATAAVQKEQELLRYLNEARSSAGLPALQLCSQLQRAARFKSNDMVSNNYFAHDSPTYSNGLTGLFAKFGISYRAAGENIAWNTSGSARDAHNSWMNSKSHRDNILKPVFTHAGIGIAVSSDGRHYYTQLFVGR